MATRMSIPRPSCDLRPMRGAAKHCCDAQIELTAIGAEIVADLGCELARRRKDEDTAAFARRFRICREAMQDRQCEGRRFAGSGLCDADKIAPLQEGWDRLLLDRSWYRVTGAGKRFKDWSAQGQGRIHSIVFFLKPAKAAFSPIPTPRWRGLEYSSEWDTPRGLGCRFGKFSECSTAGSSIHRTDVVRLIRRPLHAAGAKEIARER